MELIIACSPGLHSKCHIVLNFPTLSSTLTHCPSFIPILLDSRYSFGQCLKLPYLHELTQALDFAWNFNFCSNLTTSRTVLSNMMANSHLWLFTLKVKLIKSKIQFLSLTSHISVLSSHILLDSATVRSLECVAFPFPINRSFPTES